MRNETIVIKPIKIMAFIFGIFCCENITAIFSVGNSSFSIGQIVSVVFFVILFVRNDFKIPKIPLSLKLFFCAIVFSGFFSILYFRTEGFTRYVVGIIELAIALCALFVAIYLFEYKESIIKGFLAGLLVNIVLVFIAYITFNRGGAVLPSGLFLAKQFYTPLYSFRSQGAFLEPSHFIRFIAIIFLPVLFYLTSKKHKVIITIVIIASVAFCLWTSESGTVVVCFFEALAYAIFVKRSLSTKLITIFLSIMALFALMLLPLDLDVIKTIIKGADITDVGNAYRFQSMQLLIKEIPKYPFGAGWNMTGTVIQSNNLTTVAAFSDIIEMILEVGVIGICPYLILIFSTIVNCLKINEKFSICLSIALASFFVLQIGTDFQFDSLNMTLLGLAIANIQMHKEKYRKYELC